MPIRVALQHRTSYSYDKLVRLAPQVVRLRPAPHCRTPVLSYSLTVTPEKHFLNWQQDPHGNFLARLVFLEKARELCVTVDLVAEMTVINPFAFFLQDEAIEYPFRYEDAVRTDLLPYLEILPAGPRLKEFLADVPRKGKKTVDFLVDLNRYVHKAIRYVIRKEPGVQTCEETLTLRSGSCRDSGWLLVQVLRNLGLAARFVSGYLIQLKPDMKPLDGPPGPASDFTDLHAWAEVYLPGAGWVGLDPTSGLLAGEGHLPLAATPNPDSAAPISGGLEPCESKFFVDMSVTRVADAPRVTKPYTEEQWAAVEQLGHQVDARLEALDVRLTMGGEPTFVSIDDMEGPEWNMTADSPQKRRLAGTLLRRLSHCYGRGALLHFGQGKWYPGESLPRWALGCYWRKDGEPIWRKPELIAVDHDQGYMVPGPDHRANPATALAFIKNLAERLHVHSDHVLSGYEDTWYHLWKERRLPANVDPLKSHLENEEERKRLARIFEAGLGQVVGYALPIRPIFSDGASTRWESGRWLLRQENMFLLPGDSPMGLRLPLDSLPWYASDDTQGWQERDPLAPRGPLPSRGGNAANRNGHDRPAGDQPSSPSYAPDHLAGVPLGPSTLLAATLEQVAGTVPIAQTRYGFEAASNAALREAAEPFAETLIAAPTSQTIRTALCVEPREGRMHVFMPPVARLEDYLNLVAAIEDTAEELAMPVMIEGYTPPWDHRLQHFKVTPDPGVIEVNLQPSANWTELVGNTTTLYDEARRSRLGTEKFMLDGRHTGTGGGNHIVLGGAKPSDSPWLRRPDLLRSMVTYWNNRPSLSYLFSGLFVGPTSQAPRVDEARHESLYELETAFTQLPEGAGTALDGRSPLPQSAGGPDGQHAPRGVLHRQAVFARLGVRRLGLVELRSFEMPPHARMSLTQQLLVRAMVARFWEVPYRQPLVRWGTSLHDRFMLPHFIVQDFLEVLAELRTWGLPFEPEWFVPHFEFRFPLLGEATYEGITLELRQAIEPWHVLGEETVATATARYVDSSVERLEVKVRGMTGAPGTSGSRHVVVCNGRRVPLHATGTPGEYVAGVRFRAWQPPNCLHPTIGVHAPLVFDLYDRWSKRSIGGCTWHVSHPGGVNFPYFPVNAPDAESRRAARFQAMGHTGGPLPLPPREHNTDYPMTLDLRRPAEITEL